MNRRELLAGSFAALAVGTQRAAAATNVPVPISFDMTPPMDTKANYIAWMQKNRGEDPNFLSQRWDLCQDLLARRDIWDKRSNRAFLLIPREEFVTQANLAQAYAPTYLDIGFGVSITGPLTVGRMTSALDVKLGDKGLRGAIF